MGQLAGKMFSVAKREVKMYNIEKRAEDVISKDKPTAAPMYSSTRKELERLKEENVSMDHVHEKDAKLGEYLKQVYVTSPDDTPPLKRLVNPARPLPQSRHRSLAGYASFGYSEEEEAHVPVGRVSLKHALQFISNHASDPEKYTNKTITDKYRLSIETTDNILEHFKMFNVHVQKKKPDSDSITDKQDLSMKFREMTMFNVNNVMKEMKSFKKNEETNAKSEDTTVIESSEEAKNLESRKKDDKENR